MYITGDITIGAKTVIHPKARIIAEAGPIIIGRKMKKIITVFNFYNDSFSLLIFNSNDLNLLIIFN